jgi:hypothetical protein
MAYTAPPDFVAGDPLTEADLDVLSDDISYLYGVSQGVTLSGCQLRRTSTQSIGNTTWVAVTWQTESGGFDVGSWWSSGTNIVVPAGAIPPGYTTIAVDIRASTNFSADAAGTRFMRILVNGSEARKSSLTGIGGGDVTDIDVAHTVIVAAGDVITIEVYQSSGSSLTISGSNTIVSALRRAPVA